MKTSTDAPFLLSLALDVAVVEMISSILVVEMISRECPLRRRRGCARGRGRLLTLDAHSSQTLGIDPPALQPAAPAMHSALSSNPSLSGCLRLVRCV